MSWWGIAKGLGTFVAGIAEADGERILKGLAGTALGAAGTVIHHIVDEEAGKALSDLSEQTTSDDFS